MAKFLKFIANLLLVLMILIGLAILIPPVAGVTTVVRDEQIESNTPVGSITYAWRTSIA
ncbi:MAG: hypothetical protein HUJ73_03025, partial [Eubacterium sp.]|nr:hypothetical protein [Eubacterium sp.]